MSTIAVIISLMLFLSKLHVGYKLQSKTVVSDGKSNEHLFLFHKGEYRDELTIDDNVWKAKVWGAICKLNIQHIYKHVFPWFRQTN